MGENREYDGPMGIFEGYGKEPAPWYPPGEGWIEWEGGENPAPRAKVECLVRKERAGRFYREVRVPSDEAGPWSHEGKGWDIVAYRVVTPAPSTVDRALFDEAVAALEEARRQVNYLHDKFAPTGTGANTLARLDAVLSKVREASK